jgi:ethanolamine ammonia-lyase large subunit
MAYSSRSLRPGVTQTPQRTIARRQVGTADAVDSQGSPWLLRRRGFLGTVAAGTAAALLPGTGCSKDGEPIPPAGNTVRITDVQPGEDLFDYIRRQRGDFDATLYRQLVGAANDYKEGDEAIGVAADRQDAESRRNARTLLGNTKLGKIDAQPLLIDEQYRLIQATTDATARARIAGWTLAELRDNLLKSDEAAIKGFAPGLTSDVIGCVIKLMSNADLIAIGKKVFHALPGSNVGQRGYMGARIQPNSPTDHVDDIAWQVFDGFAYAVGDVVLGCNPVSSAPESVSAIENRLLDILRAFKLEDRMPHCVLAHIDVQAEVEAKYPGTTGLWFQSLAGNDAANATFDVSVQKMLDHAARRTGKYGLYFETGQGADFTNGKDQGVDMVVLEARKYGFARALKQKVAQAQRAAGKPEAPWVHVNDVAGFIGPEVFRSREQLVRCCLEDTVMGKLHGITLGLDICSTLHMDVSLDDLDWCIEQIMPANPAYLMGLPTKNDPMLGYLTTAFQDHVRVRQNFGYKVDDALWDFFKSLEVIDSRGQPTAHFGDPIWVFYKYRLAKGDTRTQAEIYAEGQKQLKEVRDRGVWVAEKFGGSPAELEPTLDREIRRLYDDGRKSLWVEFSPSFVQSLPMVLEVHTQSADRTDYIWHPPTGEQIEARSVEQVRTAKAMSSDRYNVQIIVSDGLCALALTDDGHLAPYLAKLRSALDTAGYRTAPMHIVVRNGRVRAGYQLGEILYSGVGNPDSKRAIIHLIGERPGSGHHTYSAYITAAPVAAWSKPGTIDHNITKVVSGIADTAYDPVLAAGETVRLLDLIAK